MISVRPVEPGDLDAYVRLRTDPQMMAELGGPQDERAMPNKLAHDVEASVAGRAWILMILPDAAENRVVAGTVTVWTPEDEAPGSSEIGWMVLPEFQGRQLATTSVRMVLAMAATAGRWGSIHAYPSVTNTASNRLCHRVGFSLLGERDKVFRQRVFRTNDWVIDPAQAAPASP